MRYLNAASAAREIGISEPTIRRWLKSGKLASTKTATGEYAIAEQDLQAIQKRRAKHKLTSHDRATDVRLQSHDQTIDALNSKVADLEHLSRLQEQQIASLCDRIDSLEQRIAELSQQLAMQSEKPSVQVQNTYDTTQPAKPQKRNVEPKRATLPDGCILASEFASRHSVNRRTFLDHIKIGLTNYLEAGKDRVQCESRPKPGRQKETEYFLTPEQQAGAISFWKLHYVGYVQCISHDCACHD
jgi:uncharacterized coiled-coil protein SlyX